MTAASFSISLLMAQEDTGRSDYEHLKEEVRKEEASKYMGGKVNLVLQGRSTNVDKQKA